MDAPAIPARWKVSAPELIAETFSSRIWKVVREDGSPAVVKALKPFDDVADELRGEHFLAWRRGEGAVRLLGRDGHSMLLEYAGETLLSKVLDEQGDKIATEIAAEVMARLLSPSKHSFPSELQPLRERFASLFKKAATDRANGHGSLYVEAGEIAERLLSNPHDVRPLHGDLHHENMLHGPRGWLAIDPKGVLGDPGFDAANMFYNPLDRDALCLDPERIANMAEVFATTLKQTPAAMLDHAIAYGCLSAAWHHEDDNAVEENRELSIAAAIRTVRATF
ncbi:aminoglycoside phosphotransferase family protein [Mesorhizobium sp. B283B1A]|uniref:aminoglycoside phosphotransferase family protein n=1 Tax=Mesorhizobium TaxID=68287 RepID=UPI001CD07C0E|nr:MULTISPECIES: aminoglycoside phosphotransferase family protein [Mesorhizobium]MCA0047373.1 aminoglycoside phosphotransferase family protein [Mesorhizobium sp. B283B1A]UQS63311.1 aminoglycoside phosphotransferase family protein [Mesorhizobium opportunistum]